MSARMAGRLGAAWCLAAGLMGVSGLAAPDAQVSEKPRLAVSVSNLGVTGGKLEAKDLVFALREAGWCEAGEGAAPVSWNAVPAGANRAEWVSVAVAGFGERAEASAWCFDGPGGAARRVAQVPYGISTVQGRKVWLFPVARLASAIRAGWNGAAAGTNRPALAVRVVEMGAGGAPGKGSGSAIQSLAQQAGDGAAVSVRDGLPPVEALAWSAAWENGWAPVREGGSESLTVEARFVYQAVSVSATLERGGRKQARSKNGLPEEQVGPCLVRLFDQLNRPAGISDFAFLGGRPLLLDALPDRLVYLGDGGPAGLDPLAGRQVWPDPGNKRALNQASRAAYAVRTRGEGNRTIYRYSRGVAQVDAASGAETERLPEGGASDWSFDVGPDGAGVLARGNRLTGYKAGAEAWAQEEAAEIGAGPLLAEGRVVYGNERGEVVAREAATGRELWRTPAGGGGLRGPLVALGGRVVAYAGGDESLVALEAADGRVAWKQALGDVPLQPPLAWADHILAAGKNNRLLLLRPADGSVACEKAWPTWLVCVLPVPGGGAPRLLCADLEGRVTILEGPDLRVVRETVLPARPLDGLAATNFPARWSAAGDGDRELQGLDADAGPAAIMTDRNGFAYILPMSGKE